MTSSDDKPKQLLPIDAYLLTRGIENPHQLWRSGGPGHRTMRRIYSGLPVREDTIDRLAELLDLTPLALKALLNATRDVVLARQKKKRGRR